MSDNETQILVAFTPVPGFEHTGIGSNVETLKEKSVEALESAMDTIRGMGQRLAANLDSLVETLDDNKPKEVEVEFGLSFETQGDIILVKVAGESSFKVTMTWEIK